MVTAGDANERKWPYGQWLRGKEARRDEMVGYETAETEVRQHRVFRRRKRRQDSGDCPDGGECRSGFRVGRRKWARK
ncbi:unnamed protein product [Linum trigynum]|uniref:Uncharacterized protein n=1 Tax=Linum trigynum TaxID=586398 RepID=A0AAV2CGX2_9ROSI